ncbi:hypothetical protein GCM10010983_36370 [Caulobacter rhizosphaerae]|nr:hypothetical protein GCM10010983_36370 [Caulobacter rhizosphaerae]
MIWLSGALVAVGLASTPPTPTARIPQPSLTALIETVDIATPVISPDGQSVAFRQGAASLDSNRYSLSWWIAPLDASMAARKVGDGGQALWKAEGVPVEEAPVWSGDSRYLYYRALIDGQVQVWRSRADAAGSQAVTRDEADVDQFSLDGNHLTYVVRATRAQGLDAERALYDSGVRIDHTIDPSQALFGAVELNGRMAPERLSGRWFQRDALLGQTPETTKRLDLATQALTAAPADAARPAPPDVFAAEHVIASSSSGGFGHARLVWRDGRMTLEVVRPDGAILSCGGVCRSQSPTWIAWRPGRDQVVFATSDVALRSNLYLWSLGGGVRRIAEDLGQLGGGMFGTPCAVGAEALVCVAARALSPPRLERIAIDTGRRVVLAAPNGSAPNDGAVHAETLIWRDAKGRTFSGQLVRTPGSRRTPLFINYYRCEGYLRGGVGDEWPMVALAQAGIAALCVNPTRALSADLDMVADYQSGLEGVTAAVELLDRQGLIDRTKVGMGALSMGSEVTMWVARHTKLLAAASIASLQVEPAYYWLNGVAGRDIHDGLARAWKLGAPEATPERWKVVSAALDTEHITAPLLMQLPEQEFRPTMELFARLSNSRTPVELYVFPQERHVLAQPRHRLAAYRRNLDWFRYWLQDYRDPDPAKVEQYQRWDAMARKARGD